MKLRNIISIVTAGLFMMSACTDEELIDSSAPDSGVNISLTTKGVMTKAAADGYEHSTPDEITINTCAIAFFDVSTHERVGFSYNTFDAATGNLNDGRAYYSVSDILVKGGTYNMLVLANSSLSKENIQAANTYNAFKALKETLEDQGAATFNAANLVKFGEQEVTINKGQANNIQVELTQLAARIDLSFKVNVQPEEVGEPIVEEKWSMEDLVGIVIKNPGQYEVGSDKPGECKIASHSHSGKWLYVPNNVRTTTTTKKAWIFAISNVMISNAALKSNSFMETTETAVNADDNSSYLVKDFEVVLSDGTATVPFYTYEKTFRLQENPLTVTVDGNLKYGTFTEKTIETFSAEYQWKSDQGGGGWGNSGYFDKKTVVSSETKTTQEMTETIDNMEKSYKLVFNPAKNADCNTNGVVHGNLYDIVGTIDVNTREAKFNWTLKPWDVRIREISVDIVDPAFLVVANTEMTMPNMTSISTMFQSSSPITISNIQVSNGTSYSNTKVNVTKSEGNSGSINISSELPINFVPKEISFTVTNEEGLSEDVKIHQYPPLYITASTSLNKVTGNSDNQNNRNMYEFKSLIADFTKIGVGSNWFELEESWSSIGSDWNRNGHLGTLSNRQKVASQFATYIQNNAVLAYPETADKTFNKSVSSKTNGSTSNRYVGTVPRTVQNETNNYRISPYFVLASQNGTNSSKGEQSHEEFCAGYIEQDLGYNNYPEGTVGKWRVPTKAELYLIDILQNTQTCAVKRILEGEDYWCATPALIDLMDPRLTGASAVRCVRDIYINE